MTNQHIIDGQAYESLSHWGLHPVMRRRRGDVFTQQQIRQANDCYTRASLQRAPVMDIEDPRPDQPRAPYTGPWVPDAI